ncbi:regulatory protein GemA, partial [Pasteurella multocida]
TEHQLPQSYADSMAKRSFKVDFVHWLDVWQLKKVIQMLEVYNRRQQRDEEQKTQ